MPGLDLLLYQTTAWETRWLQQMLMCCSSRLRGFLWLMLDAFCTAWQGDACPGHRSLVCSSVPDRLFGAEPCTATMKRAISVQPLARSRLKIAHVHKLPLIVSPNVAIKVFLEPFPAPVCQTPLRRGCSISFPVKAALITASLTAAQGIKVTNEQ